MSRDILKKIDGESILSIGLDVCKSKIDICLLGSDQETTFQITNSKKEILKFIALLEESGCRAEVPLIIESTWDYDTLACILFSQANLNIKEINPIITKNYVKHTIRWTKTDKTDAKALANIGIVNKEWLFTYNKSKRFIEISKKISLISWLEKQIQSLKRALQSFSEVFTNLELVESPSVKTMKFTVSELEKNIKMLQLEIEEDSLGKEDDQKVECIYSIAGVSRYMAQVFYISFAHKDFDSKKSMYAFVGYDPRLRDSGTFTGKARISKRGNAYVRKKLFQSAFLATKHCKLFKDIYDRMKEKGKHHYVCVISVVKKMIHIIFSLLKKNSVFDPNFTSS